MNLKPLTGASSRSSIKNMCGWRIADCGWRIKEAGRLYNRQSAIRNLKFSGRPLAAFELEADVDEVVGRPGACVLEGELALVLGCDLFDLGVELLLAVALDEEGRVHNHLVADGLVRARGHSRVAQVVVDLADVRVGLLRHRRLDESAQLHAREVGRARAARRYLLLEVSYPLALLLELGDDALAIPVDLQAELDLAGHLRQHVAQGVVGSAHQLHDVVFRAEEDAEGHRQNGELAHHGLVNLLVREDVLARRVVDLYGRVRDDRREAVVVDCVDLVAAPADADGDETARDCRLYTAVDD